MKDRKLQVAFIGSGDIAQKHMRYFQDMSDVEVVACSGRGDNNLGKVEKEFGPIRLYKDWNKMLDTEQPDAVDICTPNYLHYQPTLDALNKGCHVFLEKPLAMNALEGQEMIDCARKNNRHLVIGFQWRFDARTQMLKQAADAGQFGKILNMQCLALRRRGIPNWGVFGRKELQGGGPLMDIGVHCMEMAHYVMGRPHPVAAVGNTWTYLGNQPSNTVTCPWPNWDYKTYTVEDLAVGHIRFDNGACLQVQASFAMHGEDAFSFSFMGEKGGGRLEDPVIYRDIDGYITNTQPNFLPETDMFALKMRKFVDTVLYGKPNESPAEDGLIIQKMIDAIYQSAVEGREVLIAPNKAGTQ